MDIVSQAEADAAAAETAVQAATGLPASSRRVEGAQLLLRQQCHAKVTQQQSAQGSVSTTVSSIALGSRGAASLPASGKHDPLLLIQGLAAPRVDSGVSQHDSASGAQLGHSGGGNGGSGGSGDHGVAAGEAGHAARNGPGGTAGPVCSPTHQQHKLQLNSMRQSFWSLMQPAGAPGPTFKASPTAITSSCGSCGVGGGYVAHTSSGPAGVSDVLCASPAPLAARTPSVTPVCTPTRTTRLCEQYPDVLPHLRLRQQQQQASALGAQALRAAMEHALRTAEELRAQNERLRAALKLKTSGGGVQQQYQQPSSQPSLQQQQQQQQQHMQPATGSGIADGGVAVQGPLHTPVATPRAAGREDGVGRAQGTAEAGNGRGLQGLRCGVCEACISAGGSTPGSAPPAGGGDGAFARITVAGSPATTQEQLALEQPGWASRQRFSWRRLRSAKSETEGALTSYLASLP
ncbi:hypothetical protein HYH02_000749 [Chlamydomonas schloesseri]|uniref:Uncharacterized protein n=1 Tax=Chlamydomonas schloesseri TaxID=2026947 RepID=A0A835WV77_9CHLO|nr:hypothetical protein HYH02_000749 [Chlamydomonas schloesseri]|eukprot:KAG2454919.1 hypothetical protein HYH02_000749 [Chlamydomonas schloesseri]